MPQAISLFSGCGGCSLGLTHAGFEVALAADIDADACDTYSANLGNDRVLRTDLAQIDAKELLNSSQLTPAEVNLIVGGPPCQGFSSAGARDWTDPRNALLRNYVDIVTTLRPPWFVMENVEGLLTANNGVFIIELISRFLEAGYWVRAKKVYLEQYGLPQRRKRVVIVGNLEEQPFDFPPPTHLEQTPFPLFEQSPQLSILDALSDLPAPVASGSAIFDKPPQNEYQAFLRQGDNRAVTHHQTKQINEVIQQRIRLLSQGGTMKNLPEDLQHPSFTRRAFRRVMDGTPTEKRGGAPSGLKRLVATKPSLTITSASPTEFVHPLEDRLLTLRECARIQSFPDSFEFFGSWSSIATQIGNAIPPLFMTHLVSHISSMASWRPKANVRGRWLGIDATKASAMSPVLASMLAQLEERTYAYAR